MLKQTHHDVILYVKHDCNYCFFSKQLLDNKNIKYKEIIINDNDALKNEMELLAGKDSVPQIFIDGTHIGGYEDLVDLESKGGLSD